MHGFRNLKIATLIIAIGVIHTPIASATSTSSKLQHILKTIRTTRSELKTTQHERSTTLHKLKVTEISLSHILKKSRRTNDSIYQTQHKLNLLYKQQKNLQHTIEKQQRFLSLILRSTYTLGQKQYIKIILNQEDPTQFNRMLVYYQSLIHARTQAILDLTRTIDELDANRHEMAHHRTILRSLSQKQIKQRKQLESARYNRQKVLLKLSHTLRDKKARLNKLLHDKANLEKVIRRISTHKTVATYKFHGKFARLRGSLKWPIPGRIITRFGSSIEHSNFTNNGVSLAAAEGTKVQAIAPGSVVYAGWLNGYGLLMIIDHGSGYMSLYGHNEILYHKVGDQISSDTTIARVGTTGGVKKPQLYFAIRYHGRAVNPGIWCR